MSTYYDIKTGKWFDTLAELKAFQRGEGNTSPRFVSGQKENRSPEKNIEDNTQPVEQQEQAPEQETEQLVEDTEGKEDKPIDINPSGEISIRLSRDEMVTALKEAGVDGRSLRQKDYEAVARMYANMFGH